MITVNVIDDKQKEKKETENKLIINNTKNKNNENQQQPFNNNICFLCKKEKISNFKFKFSFLFNYFSKKRRYNNEIIQELNEISKNYYDVFIQPCKCKLYCHSICLLQYCITNLSIKCTECLYIYNFKLTELNSVKISKCVLFKLILLIIVAFIFFLGGLFFLIYHVIGHDEYIFWNYIIGIILIILSLLTFLDAYNILRNIKPQKKIFPIFLDYNNNECKNNNNSSIYNNLLNFEIFLSKIFDISRSDLIEKKMFNQICVTSKISREKEIYKFVRENNNLLEEEEKIFEEMKANSQNFISVQNVKRLSKLNGISICYAENTNPSNIEINTDENNNNTNNNNNLQLQVNQKPKNKNLLIYERPSFPLIGLKCKSNRRLTVRRSFQVEKSSEAIKKLNCLNDDNNSNNNSSELSSIRYLKNNEKKLLKTVLIHTKNKKEENIQKKKFESDIKYFNKKTEKKQ